MLSSPDADLCRRDPALPGLRLLLDPDALAAKVDELGWRLPFENFAPAYLRYKPDTNCLVGFSTADNKSAISFYGKVFPRGTGKLRAREGSIPGPGSRFTIVDEGIELVFFPADNRLALGEIFEPGPPSRFGSEGVNTSAALTAPVARTVLAYRPERRCVVFIRTDERAARVIKAYAKREFPAAAARAMALRAAVSNIPSLTSIDESNRLLFFPWISGKVLRQNMEDGTVSHSDLLATGTALAELHCQHVPSLPMRGKNVESGRLLDIAAMVGRLSPDLGTLAQGLAARIVDRLESMASDEATLHGDFGAKQVVIRDEDATLIDLDESARGKAAIDLGNFLARLEADVLGGRIPPDVIAPSRAAFLDGYAARKTIPPEPDISLATAIGLFRVAHEPFRMHVPDWPARMRALLLRVEAVLDGILLDHAEPAHAGSSIS